MNQELLYQWETELSEHLPSLNSWQVANVGLFSIGIAQAESCQQGAVARQVVQGEQVESTARRWRRFLNQGQVNFEAFFKEWTAWVVVWACVSSQTVHLPKTCPLLSACGERAGVRGLTLSKYFLNSSPAGEGLFSIHTRTSFLPSPAGEGPGMRAV